jgi:hypothetical protein
MIDETLGEAYPPLGLGHSNILKEIELSDSARRAISEAVRSEIQAACSETDFTAAHVQRIIRLAAAAKPFFASRDPLAIRPNTGPVMAQSPMTETFGAGALREVTEVMRQLGESKKQPSVLTLTKAIAEAHDAGLADVVDLLREKLRETLGLDGTGKLIGTLVVEGQERAVSPSAETLPPPPPAPDLEALPRSTSLPGAAA